MDPAVVACFQDCLQMLRHVFLADFDSAQPFILSGSGTLGWDLVAANCAVPGDAALVVSTGVFGDSFGACLDTYGVAVTVLRPDVVGDVPTLFALKAALRETAFRLVTLTHVDTSTGVIVDLEAMARTIRDLQPDAVIVVDGVCALGGEVCRMREWDLDIVLTGSQKCLGVPAGLCLSMWSARAMERRVVSPQSAYYGNLSRWLPIMQAYERGEARYFATPAVNHIFALHVALSSLLADGGMEQRFVDHADVARGIRRAVATLGCAFVPVSPDVAAHTLSCVRFPEGMSSSPQAFLAAAARYGVSLAGGLHPDVGAYFRIGHMGLATTRRLDFALQTVQAIERAFIDCGVQNFTPGVAEKEIRRLAETTGLPLKCCASSWSTWTSSSIIRSVLRLEECVVSSCVADPRCVVSILSVLAAAVVVVATKSSTTWLNHQT